MMTFEEFCTAMKEQFADYAAKGKETIETRLIQVAKNNGVYLTGLSVMRDDSNIAPNIYLDGIYEEYRNHKNFDKSMGQVAGIYAETQKSQKFTEMPFNVSDIEEIKTRIFLNLVSQNSNASYLEDIPNKAMEHLDLTAIMRVGIDSEEGSASFVIKESHLAMWNTSLEELYPTALENTQRMFPLDLRNMKELMAEIMREGFSGEDMPYEMREMLSNMPDNQSTEGRGKMYLEPFEQYVLGNQSKLYGATVLLYPGVMEQIAEQSGSNIFILPSSIHECILMRDNADTGPEELQRMVIEVNATQVDPEEVLSNEVYCYNQKEHSLTMATDPERTQALVSRYQRCGELPEASQEKQEEMESGHGDDWEPCIE